MNLSYDMPYRLNRRRDHALGLFIPQRLALRAIYGKRRASERVLGVNHPGDSTATHLLAVKRCRDMQSVEQKPLPRGDGAPLRVLRRHVVVRALDVDFGHARVHVAKEFQQIELIQIEPAQRVPPDRVLHRAAVVLGHDFPGRIVHLHFCAHHPGERGIRLTRATSTALDGSLRGGRLFVRG